VMLPVCPLTWKFHQLSLLIRRELTLFGSI